MASYINDSSTSEDSSCTSDTSSDHSLHSVSTSTGNQPGGRSRKHRGKRRSRQDRVIVWVGNLSPSCTSQQLLQHFSEYKSLIRNKPKLLTPKNKESATQRYSLLHFDNMVKAREVMQAMNNSKFQGRKIIVNLKKDKDSRKSSQSEVTPLTVEVSVSVCVSIVFS